jgi:hypothetical protein
MCQELDLPHEVAVAFLSIPLWSLVFPKFESSTFSTTSFAFSLVIPTPLKYGDVITFEMVTVHPPKVTAAALYFKVYCED